jgi:hypothetical protein
MRESRSEFAAHEALAAQAIKRLPSDTRQALLKGRSEALQAARRHHARRVLARALVNALAAVALGALIGLPAAAYVLR